MFLDSDNLDVVLTWHLQHNHYPALPTVLVSVARAAIEACQDEDYERLIPLPTGLGFVPEAPAWEIAETLHLDAFISFE